MPKTKQRNSLATVTAPCGCEYFADNGQRPLQACEQHRWITCASCHGKAEVTFIGVWCATCSK